MVSPTSPHLRSPVSSPSESRATAAAAAAVASRSRTPPLANHDPNQVSSLMAANVAARSKPAAETERSCEFPSTLVTALTHDQKQAKQQATDSNIRANATIAAVAAGPLAHSWVSSITPTVSSRKDRRRAKPRYRPLVSWSAHAPPNKPPPVEDTQSVFSVHSSGESVISLPVNQSVFSVSPLVSGANYDPNENPRARTENPRPVSVHTTRPSSLLQSLNGRISALRRPRSNSIHSLMPKVPTEVHEPHEPHASQTRKDASTPTLNSANSATTLSSTNTRESGRSSVFIDSEDVLADGIGSAPANNLDTPHNMPNPLGETHRDPIVDSVMESDARGPVYQIKIDEPHPLKNRSQTSLDPSLATPPRGTLAVHRRSDSRRSVDTDDVLRSPDSFRPQRRGASFESTRSEPSVYTTISVPESARSGSSMELDGSSPSLTYEPKGPCVPEKKKKKGFKRGFASLFKNVADSRSRLSPSPAPMMHTLRDENDKRNFNEEKPWKGHHGLNHLSERERKRYESLWAANRGSHLPYLYVAPDYEESWNAALHLMYPRLFTNTGSHPSLPDTASSRISIDDESAHKLQPAFSAFSSDEEDTDSVLIDMDKQAKIRGNDIHGYVVSRIWRRSRLPEETLREIWELVDLNKDGSLDRAGFVVGMWLCDQCLYGRKLPPKVPEVVWNSVGKLHLKVRVKPKTSTISYVKNIPNIFGLALGSTVHGGRKAVKKAVQTAFN